MGSIDRVVRVALGLALAILGFFVFQSTLWIILGILGVIFLATAVLGFCPLYLPFKINTVRK
jgi:hypothetical protein